jgi:hypothetical protein
VRSETRVFFTLAGVNVNVNVEGQDRCQSMSLICEERCRSMNWIDPDRVVGVEG